MGSFCGECGTRLEQGRCPVCDGPGQAPPGQVTSAGPVAHPAQTTQHVVPAQSRGALRAAIAFLALVLVLGVGGVVLALTTGGEDAETSEETGIRDEPETPPGLTGGEGPQIPVADVAFDNGLSLLDQPATEWSLAAEDLVPRGRFSSTSPFADGPSVRPVVVGNVLVTYVWPKNGTDGVLAGVDAESGDVLWQRSQPSSLCAGLLRDTMIGCWRWSGSEVTLYDAATGDESGRLPGQDLISVVADGDDALLVGLTQAQQLRVTRVDVETGDEQWTTMHENPGPELTHGHSATLVDGVLEAGFSVATWLVDAGTGALLGSSGDGIPLRGGYVMQVDEGGTVVTDEEGYVFLWSPDSPWWGETPADKQADDGLLGVGRAVYDLATGSQIWERLDLPQDATLEWTPDGSQVRAVSGDMFTMLDAVTGSDQWSHLLPSEYPDDLYTRDAVALTDPQSGDVEVLSRETGELVWADQLSARPPRFSWVETVLADSALVMAHDRTLSGWAGFASGNSGGGVDADTDSGTTVDTAPDYVTGCGSEPEFTPVESEAARGGLMVTYEVTAVCPDGQWLSADGMSVTMSGAVGDSEGVVASGRFDFSDAPVWVAPEGVTMRLVYPASSVYATESELTEAISQQTIVVKCIREPGATDGEVPLSPEYAAAADEPVQAVDAALGTEEERESALEALRRIAAEDDASVENSMEGRWVPQLSSKVKGTTDDGIVYSYADILAEHLRLRLRYSSPGVQLVNSSDWGSFLSPGYWVTLVDSPTAGPEPALGFCREQGFDRDHCYAKRLLREGPAEGSTKLMEGP